MDTERVCIKVSNLRKKYDKDMTLEKWMKDENNEYVGRRGRIFINKVIYTYKDSIWANPYTVKDYGIDKCLLLYEEYIKNMIKDNPDVYDINKLKGKKLGCWCNNGDRCHVDILLQMINNNT